jgi:hypothetical protein
MSFVQQVLSPSASSCQPLNCINWAYGSTTSVIFRWSASVVAKSGHRNFILTGASAWVQEMPQPM